LVKAVVLVKSPKKLIAARLRMVKSVYDSFPVSGQFDAVALIEVKELSQIKDVTNDIHSIKGVERTETLVQVV
jgi:DNA-binding Lrp family transcriptional regulator